METHIYDSLVANVRFFDMMLLLTAILSLVFRRIRSQITSYSFQSFALSCICFLVAYAKNSYHIYIAGALTFAIKCVIIPIFLKNVSNKTKICKDTEKFLTVPTALIIAGILIIFSHELMLPVSSHLEPLTKGTLNTSVSLILIGILLMINRTYALTQVLGILIIENGLFLAGISTTYGMPLIVELSAFFDIIVGVVVMGILTNKINESFDTLDTNKLNLLKH